MTSVTKRKYHRRSEAERIAELEAKLAQVQARVEAKTKRDKDQDRKHNELMREIPKLRKRLKGFSQLAADHNRMDISNTAMAFLLSLNRFYEEDITEEVHWSEPLGEIEPE